MKKDSRKYDSAVQEVDIILPIDGGYGWLIVVAAFLSNFVVDGISFSFGVCLLSVLSKELEQPTSKVAIISSVQLGVYYLFGPLACAFINRYGFRTVGIYGSVISFTGVLIAAHIKSYHVILIFYGIIGGLGFGMIYTSSIISVGYYFEKYRALSTGISVCGSSMGGLCLSPFFAYIVDKRDWQDTMRVQSGLLVVCLLSSLTYRPLQPTKVALTPEIINEADQRATPSRVEFVELYKTNSMESVDLTDDFSQESRHFPQISIISSRFLPITEREKKKRHSSCMWLRNLFSKCLSKKKKRVVKFNAIPTGPLDRKDIFYSASVVHLPEYQVMTRNENLLNTNPSLSYHISVILDSKALFDSKTTLIQTGVVTQPANTRGCFGISHMIHNALGKLFDFTLLKSFVFCILAVACFCFAFAWMTPYIFLPERAEQNNIKKSSVHWFVSVISIGNTIGRALAGILATVFPNLNSCYMIGIATISAGAVTILSAFMWTDVAEFQITYCFIFGFCIAFLSAMRPIVFVKLLGLDKLTNAFGLSAVVIGIGILSGTPISSALVDNTNSFMPAFVLSGGMFILCGCLIISAFHIYEWEERKKINEQ